MLFSKREIKDIVKAWLAVTIAFGIVLSKQQGLLLSLLISFIAVGLGFLLHELAHKFVAQKLNYFAEFFADDKMLLAAIAMSFLGFVFAAPGAVVIRGPKDVKKNGLISVAGPLMNIILAIVFLSLTLISDGFVKTLFIFGFRINSWMAVFNMLPFWILDGKKVWEWDKKVFWVAMIMAAGLLFI